MRGVQCSMGIWGDLILAVRSGTMSHNNVFLEIKAICVSLFQLFRHIIWTFSIVRLSGLHCIELPVKLPACLLFEHEFIFGCILSSAVLAQLRCTYDWSNHLAIVCIKSFQGYQLCNLSFSAAACQTCLHLNMFGFLKEPHEASVTAYKSWGGCHCPKASSLLSVHVLFTLSLCQSSEFVPFSMNKRLRKALMVQK